MKKTSYILLTLIITLSLTGRASDVLVLSDQFDDYDLIYGQLDVLEEDTTHFGVSEIVSGRRSNLFKKNQKKTAAIKNIHHVYWYRFRIQDLSEKGKRWVLENQDAHIDDFEFYVYSNRLKKYKKQSAGLYKDFGIRPYPHKNFVFDLPLEHGELSPYFYVRVKSRLHNPMLFKIRSSNYFVSYALNEYYLLGIFYGVLIIMMMYNLFIYFSIKEKVYLLYIVYVLSSIFLFLSEDGLGFQYLWPGSPGVNAFINDYKTIFFLLSFSMYGITFLQLKENQYGLYKFLLYSIGAYLVYVLFIYLIVDDKFIRLFLRSLFYLVPFGLLYAASIRAFKKGFKPARFFIIGYSFVLLGLMFLLLREIGVTVFNNLFTIYSLNIGVVIEIVALSMALGERLKILKDEKEQALERVVVELTEKEQLKDKVNRELEEKVSSRTKELEDTAAQLKYANDQLHQQQEEINKMNLQLDVANRKLKNEVKNIATQLTSGKTVSYEEFLEVYPTKESCLILIADLKWKNGYKCKKCGHESFCNGRSFRSKRCTKCTFDESVTNFTLFKSLKFPIEKAFYMTYLVYKSKETVSPTVVSDKIDLRLSTCFHFIKKVEGQMNLAKKHKKAIQDWTDLVPLTYSE